MENFDQILGKAKSEMDSIANAKSTQRILPEISSEDFTKLFKIHVNAVLLRKCSNDTFSRDKELNSVIGQLKLWLQNNPEFNGNTRKGILLNGKIGVGKTLIMEAFTRTYNSLCSADDERIRYKDARQMFYEITKDGIKELSKGILFIDDLGKEPLEYINYGYKSLPMVELLSERYRLGRLTFATSNFTADKGFKEKYELTISDRIKEMFNIIELKGESKR